VTNPPQSDQATNEADAAVNAAVDQPIREARIIPFPARAVAPPVAAPLSPTPDHDRLVRALQSLNAALADQRVALAAWRAVLGDLKATTTGLDDSLQRYRSSLSCLGDSVNGLRDKARGLEQWADRAIALDQ
jgi:hypothetical protein